MCYKKKVCWKQLKLYVVRQRKLAGEKKQSWWWDESVSSAVEDKRWSWKKWKVAVRWIISLPWEIQGVLSLLPRNMQNDSGHLAVSNNTKKKTWKDYYLWVLNIESPSSVEDLPAVEPVPYPPILVTPESVAKMKSCKSPGPSGIATEVHKAIC